VASVSIKVTAWGTLIVFGGALGNHVYSLSKDPGHQAPVGVAVTASTTSDSVVVNTVTAEKIELPPKNPGVKVNLKST